MKSIYLLVLYTVFIMGCSDQQSSQKSSAALEVLETAISDVGYWRWWTKDASGTFQVEFGGVLLYNKPTASNMPPSSLLALCFTDTRCVAALRRHTGLPEAPNDWFDRLGKDKMDPPTLTHGEFTLTSAQELRRIVAQSEEKQFVLGSEADLESVQERDAFLAFWAGDVGLLIIAREMSSFTSHEELNPELILRKSDQWWEYWREYWKRRDSIAAMPKDYACEVTIPLKE